MFIKVSKEKKMMFTPQPPPKLDPKIMKAEAENKQREMRRDAAIRMPLIGKIIGLIIMLAFIVMLILMNVFHLF